MVSLLNYSSSYLTKFQTVHWAYSALGLIWCAFCSSLWVNDWYFIPPVLNQITLSPRYIPLGIFERPSYKEDLGLWHTCCWVGSNNLIREKRFQSVCRWFWKFWGLESYRSPLVCRTDNKFVWCVKCFFILSFFFLRPLSFFLQVKKITQWNLWSNSFTPIESRF